MLNQLLEGGLLLGLLLPLFGTTLGAGCVFFLKRQIHPLASAKVKQGSLAICAGILGCPFSHATSRQNRGHV